MIKKDIKNLIQKFKKLQRRVLSLNKTNVIADLDKLEISSGSNIFLHSRLSTIGYLEDGPDWFIEYFLDKIGPEGNLFMPSFSSNDYAVNYLKEDVLFDPQKTPSKMGVLTSVFLEKYNALRSIHGTHSVLGIGPKAYDILSTHQFSKNPFDKHSPFFKFLALENPKVVCLGLTMFPATIFRVFESVKFPDYPLKIFLDQEFQYQAIINGELNDLTTLAHNPEVSNKRRNMLFENQFLSKGILKSYKIGNSKSYMLDANDFLSIMEENYNYGNLPYLDHYRDFEKDKVDFSRLAKTWESW